ncbi:glucokinase [Halarcobacter sp.]|uniref:glucokinase n=1 Tax=Halarcobacter sp. TaxID=2321133 RepID=UPI002AAC14FB|nr:glucokinase [Halarcobacter sp.]
MILSGDIGGTKTKLALYKIEDNSLSLYYEKQFSSKKYNSFLELLEEFKNGAPKSDIEAITIGIAGPIIEQRCRTTNLPWDISTEELKKYFNTQKVKLLNDLEATAYGMLYLKNEEFYDLNPNGRDIKGNIAVIAAGTGLGEAILYWDGNSFSPIGTEGGHSDFAPITSQQDELLTWLRKRYPGHVSYERVASGMGISTIYEFLYESGFAKQGEFIANMDENSDKSALISKGALELNDPLCIETLKLFAEIYAAEAGNLALKSMSLGGVYIGGGIAPKILPIIKSDYFLNAFFSKGRFEELLRMIPLRVSLNPNTALLGATRYAFDKLI